MPNTQTGAEDANQKETEHDKAETHVQSQRVTGARHLSNAEQTVGSLCPARFRTSRFRQLSGQAAERRSIGYRKLYQVAEIRSRSAATRCTWMVRR
jgi:hypothetical protein